MKPLITFIFIIAIGLFSCSSKHGNVDKYYTDHGDWDNIRFPLIKPYEALRLTGDHNWTVQLTENANGLFSAPNTKGINVINRVVFLYCTHTILNGADAKEAWFILIPDKHVEKGFATHKEYLSYLNSLNIMHEPKLYGMEQVSIYFGKHDTVDWPHLDK